MNSESVKKSSDNITQIDEGRASSLLHYLEPLSTILNGDNVEEVNINKAGELFVNYNNKPKERIEKPEFTNIWLEQLGRLIASYTNQAIGDASVSLTGTLPNKERCQVVVPSGCDPDYRAFSIRKPSSLLFSLDDFRKQGAFDDVEIEIGEMSNEDKELLSLFKAKNYSQFLKLAVKYKKNMILSGGTGAGKTTFLKGLALEIPVDERIVSIEDNRELKVNNPDFLPLLFTKDNKGKSQHTAEDCVKWALRLNPDRLLMSELTGGEAQAYLRAIKSGHPGSLTTVHADNPSEALDNIVMMIQNNSKTPQPEEQIRSTLKRTVNIVVQYSKIGYSRVVPEIYFDLFEKDRGRL